MSDADDGHKRKMAEAFTAYLNASGFPFQFAVQRQAQHLFDRARWCLEAAEFPVAVQGTDTRIDLLLGKRLVNEGYRRLLVVECKRVNPKLGRWLFAKNPAVRFNEEKDSILVDRVQLPDASVDEGLFAGVHNLGSSRDIYHLALEAKTSAKGRSSGEGRGNIEQAATQVMRGVNGLIECIQDRPTMMPMNRDVSIVPAIFTTAELWSTTADIGRASIETGELKVEESEVERKPWLWYRYHASPGLLHSVRRHYNTMGRPDWETGIPPLLDWKYARAIAVVSPGGIEEFLTSQVWG